MPRHNLGRGLRPYIVEAQDLRANIVDSGTPKVTKPDDYVYDLPGEDSVVAGSGDANSSPTASLHAGTLPRHIPHPLQSASSSMGSHDTRRHRRHLPPKWEGDHSHRLAPLPDTPDPQVRRALFHHSDRPVQLCDVGKRESGKAVRGSPPYQGN